jgi:AcrR family transcriptional regulator
MHAKGRALSQRAQRPEAQLDMRVPSRLRPAVVDGAVRQGGYVVEMQRRRLLTAANELVFEKGVQAMTVASVSQRAGVSRKTFYDLFADRESCLLSAFEEAVTRAAQAVRPAFEAEGCWRVRMRGGLLALLCFMDEEPALARLLVVEALSAGPRVIERRGEIVCALTAAVDRGRAEVALEEVPSSLTAEAVVGAVFAVIHARLLDAEPGGVSRPLVELTSELVGVIVYPYLGPSVAREEVKTPVPAPSNGNRRRGAAKDAFKDTPLRLTYRTARVLASIAVSPGASNKQIATASGVGDQGQMSRLLTRLERYGLVHNTGGRPASGEARAWRLTEKGEGMLGAAGIYGAPS